MRMTQLTHLRLAKAAIADAGAKSLALLAPSRTRMTCLNLMTNAISTEVQALLITTYAGWCML
jgi:hypothetical protein